MRVIFFGTPDYVIPVLNALNKYHEIVAVVTQGPKEVGRKKIITYSDVDHWAHKRKIEKYYDFDDLPEAELGVCASFGMIIPKEVLTHFKFGILNIHPSLLPKYRGASPIQQTIINNDLITGVTIIKMDEKMDHGPIVTQFKEETLPDDTFETLRKRLFEKASEVLVELIPNYVSGKINLKKQDENEATFTKIISKQDGFVDLENDDPKLIESKLRAYAPWPGIHTKIIIKNKIEKRLKILKCHLEKDQLVIEEVQLEGKNPVTWQQFQQAYSL